jgi:orotate phosphoribosyltransferase-like protein
MNNLRILHLTDWHIDNPNAVEEKLRKGFFRDYINSLYNEMKAQGKEKIDMLVCSGDFINKGKIENFDHAKQILDFLIFKFNIKPENAILVIGNHDMKVSNHKVGDRSAYDAFSSKYGLPKKIISEKLFSIAELPNKTYVLELDSVYNEKEEINNDADNHYLIRPSQLKDETLDHIVTSVEENILQPNLLIVVTHFPMSLNDRMKQIHEESGWVEKHLWKNGRDIIQRIINNKIDTNIICLYGDGHIDNYWPSSEKHIFFMTGMFGGNYVKRTYQKEGETFSFEKTNDAKVIEFVENNLSPNIFTFSYYPEGFTYSPQSGSWKMEVGKIVVEEKTSITYPALNTAPEQDILERKVELISSQIQDTILEFIKAKQLYYFARTKTSEKESSLGWVPISTLFENRELLSGSVEKINEWVSKVSKYENSESCVLIGLGFWGGIFATQLNSRRNNPCYLVSSKRIKQNHIYFESIDYIINQVASFDIKEIIILTDVISTGNSILELKQRILEKLNISSVKFLAVSIISDKNQQRLQKIEEFHKIGSLCIDLPIPVIENDKLPDESIFPVEYDFR